MPFRVTALPVGVRRADQGIMTYQHGYGKPIWLPMWSFLVEGEGRTILVDTGLDDFVTPPGFTEETGIEPVYIEDALSERGISPDDVDTVINTHLHDDHCANNQLFERATVYVQRAEVAFCRDPHPIDGRYDASLIEGLSLRIIEGDRRILPGLSVLFTPGHSPGTQTVCVETEGGLAVIAGMCSNCENFPARGAAICPGVHTDSIAGWETAQRIRAVADAAERAVILPLHAPEVPALLRELG